MKVKNGRYVDRYGDVEWFKDGQLHRDNDLPALVKNNGSTAWYFNGQLHRKNGPAVVHPDGEQQWWIYGQLHREDGPAMIQHNGFFNTWFIYGIQYTEEEFNFYLEKKKLEKSLNQDLDIKNSKSCAKI